MANNKKAEQIERVRNALEFYEQQESLLNRKVDIAIKAAEMAREVLANLEEDAATSSVESEGSKNKGKKPLSAASIAVAVLRERGEEMHIDEIYKEVTKQIKLLKTSLYTELYRRAKRRRGFYKGKGATFGLLKWKEQIKGGK